MSLENSCANPAFPIPLGSILPYMGLANEIPPTFLLCDGRVVSKVNYPELYILLGDTFNGTGVVSEGEFYLPKLNNQETYLVPNGTLKTDPTRANGIIPPYLHSSDVLPALTGSEIPQLSPANFTPTYPKDQEGITGRSFNGRGDYQNSRYLATDSTGSSNPPIVKLNSSNESGGFATMNTADYIYQNPTPAPVDDIILNADHTVQYGGITCLYIIRAMCSYQVGSARAAGINARTAEQVAYVAGVAKQEAAEDIAVAVADAQNDQSAINAANAIAADGEGGGTTYPYADVPQLEGFILPASAQY